MTKRCSHCNEEKPLTEYYKSPKHRDGHKGQCKRCEINKAKIRLEDKARREKRNARSRARHAASPDRRREQGKWSDLWKCYRMRREDYEAILEAQDGKCAICGATEAGGNGKFHVDHDHACCPGNRSCGGCVRGLLCCRCNPLLGYARDSEPILESAILYLKSRRLTAVEEVA